MRLGKPIEELPQGVAVLGWQQEYTASHSFKATTLTDAATIAWDLSTNQVAKVTLGGNRALGNPTNGKDGGVYILFVTQDGTGSRTLSYDSNVYKWPTGGLTPVLTTSANRTDILTFVSLGGKMYGSVAFNYVA
jgi:hypothetical protein